MKAYRIKAFVEIEIEAFNAEDARDAVSEGLMQVESFGAVVVDITVASVEQKQELRT